MTIRMTVRGFILAGVAIAAAASAQTFFLVEVIR